MSFQTAILWAFDTAPSRLPKLFWSYSLADLEEVCRRKVEDRLISAHQQKASLFEVVAAALGGKKEVKAKPAKNLDDLMSGVRALGGMVG